MAKSYNPNNMDQRQAEIRKAKGNPNKNIHHKKKNSNYHGYAAAQHADKAAKAANKRERQPAWIAIVMVAIFVVLIAVLVLMNGVYKDSEVFSRLASLIIGICCGVLFGLRRFNKEPEKGGQKVLSIVLAVMAVVYTFMGAIGLIQLL